MKQQMAAGRYEVEAADACDTLHTIRPSLAPLRKSRTIMSQLTLSFPFFLPLHRTLRRAIRRVKQGAATNHHTPRPKVHTPYPFATIQYQ